VRVVFSEIVDGRTVADAAGGNANMRKAAKNEIGTKTRAHVGSKAGAPRPFMA